MTKTRFTLIALALLLMLTFVSFAQRPKKLNRSYPLPVISCTFVEPMAVSIQAKKPTQQPPAPKDVPPDSAPPPTTIYPEIVCGRSTSGQYTASILFSGSDPSRPSQAFLSFLAETLGTTAPVDWSGVSLEVRAENITRMIEGGSTYIIARGERLTPDYFGYPAATGEVVCRFAGVWEGQLPEGLAGSFEAHYNVLSNPQPPQDGPGNPVRERRDMVFAGTCIIDRFGCYGR